MEEMAVNGKRFGDERSTLLDEFERLSFEAHAAELKRAMLGRSLSEPALPRSRSRLIGVAPVPLAMQGRRRGSGFHRVLKKLLRPILGRNRGGGGRKHVPDAEDPLSLEAFTRS